MTKNKDPITALSESLQTLGLFPATKKNVWSRHSGRYWFLAGLTIMLGLATAAVIAMALMR